MLSRFLRYAERRYDLREELALDVGHHLERRAHEHHPVWSRIGG
jgi:hypothetical protein